MTEEEAIKILSPNSESRLVRAADGFLPTQKVLCALELAVSALRAQQTTAKPDRSRWEGCGFCNKINQSRLKGIMYCAKCGRPITEEAWAELERRINDGTAD